MPYFLGQQVGGKRKKRGSLSKLHNINIKNDNIYLSYFQIGYFLTQDNF